MTDHTGHTLRECLERSLAAMTPSASVPAVQDECHLAHPAEDFPGHAEQRSWAHYTEAEKQAYEAGISIELAWESDDYSYDDRDELSWQDEAAQDEFIDSAMDYLTHEYPEVPF
jgi:hypothetical protein